MTDYCFKRLVGFAARFVVAAACVAAAPAGAGRVWAQDPIVVQLPTYSFFYTDSSMLVPDRGTGVMGGMRRSSSGSNQFGGPLIPSTRSSGSATGAGGVTVSAQIHDLDDLDQQTLARAARLSRPAGAVAPPFKAPAGEAVAGPDAAPLVSVEALAARKRASAAAEQQEAEHLVVKARDALAAGKSGAAKVYLQMAARRAEGARKAEIFALIGQVDANHAGGAPARSAAATKSGATVDGSAAALARPPATTSR
jgi:hypothetical protein